DHWELYDLQNDPAGTDDRSEQHPERVANLVDAWETAAWANQVFPLDEGSGLKSLQRPPTEGVFSEPVTLYPGTPTLEHYRASQLIEQRSFRVTIRLDYRPGDQGVLVAHGDLGGGYVVYIEDGELHLYYHAFWQERRLRGGVVPS